MVAASGLPNREVARLVGVHRTSLARFITGQSPVPLVVANAIYRFALQAEIRHIPGRTQRAIRLPYTPQGGPGRPAAATQEAEAARRRSQAHPAKVVKRKRKRWIPRSYDPTRWTPLEMPEHPMQHPHIRTFFRGRETTLMVATVQ